MDSVCVEILNSSALVIKWCLQRPFMYHVGCVVNAFSLIFHITAWFLSNHFKVRAADSESTFFSVSGKAFILTDIIYGHGVLWVTYFFPSFEAAVFLSSHTYFHIFPHNNCAAFITYLYFNIWSCFSLKRLYIIWLSCEWLVFLGFLRCEFSELTEYLYSFTIFQKFFATHGSSHSMCFGKHGITTLWIVYRILLTLFSLCILYRFILSSTFFSNLISAINSLNETDYSYFMFISNIWCHEFMITTQLSEL